MIHKIQSEIFALNVNEYILSQDTMNQDTTNVEEHAVIKSATLTSVSTNLASRQEHCVQS